MSPKHICVGGYSRPRHRRINFFFVVFGGNDCQVSGLFQMHQLVLRCGSRDEPFCTAQFFAIYKSLPCDQNKITTWHKWVHHLAKAKLSRDECSITLMMSKKSVLLRCTGVSSMYVFPQCLATAERRTSTNIFVTEKQTYSMMYISCARHICLFYILCLDFHVKIASWKAKIIQ